MKVKFFLLVKIKIYTPWKHLASDRFYHRFYINRSWKVLCRICFEVQKLVSLIIVILLLFQYGKGELKFSSLTFEDSGMYQCIAENNWGTIYANAELRVVCELHSTPLCKFVIETVDVLFRTFQELAIWIMF